MEGRSWRPPSRSSSQSPASSCGWSGATKVTAGTEPEQVKELRRGGLLTSVTRPPRDDLWKFDGSIPLDDMHPHVLAQSRRQPHKFKAFRSELEVPNSWGIVDGVAEVWSTWEAFGQS